MKYLELHTKQAALEQVQELLTAGYKAFYIKYNDTRFQVRYWN